tara:strand:- start:475 stop:588 length:114 start_codon:yes stop_codon:yes gene_type:complete
MPPLVLEVSKGSEDFCLLLLEVLEVSIPLRIAVGSAG